MKRIESILDRLYEERPLVTALVLGGWSSYTIWGWRGLVLTTVTWIVLMIAFALALRLWVRKGAKS